MKVKVHPTEEQELKQADKIFNDLVRRAKIKGALISLTEGQTNEKPFFKQQSLFLT